ncbi:hypothetical protein GUJ93_ZPchr0004g40029 [Zizania palustris]|uniref:Seed specific protein Bn15D1B n=1 Tax=Zizania palustris TaxID=103762 RepID=A0A8J5T0Y1_ZIZPA|nr:hypothetical protein GUJ93_ZPchr0004g40029 [Zizania palustris]
MAAVASSKGRVIVGSFIARVLAASPRRTVSASAYDKNLEDHARPAVVPDDVIGGSVGDADKYWGPHPTTGVFGPAVDGKAAAAGAANPGANGGGGSVLDQKVWFRPLEDVEKPPPVA